MKRFDLKQLLLCIATLVSSQFELAGVYPLILLGTHNTSISYFSAFVK